MWDASESWTRDLILTKDALYHWAKAATTLGQSFLTSAWSGKRGSNPRPPAWKASALSTELFPPFPPEKSLFSASPQHKVNFLRSACAKIPLLSFSRAYGRSVIVFVWARMDSNHRSVDAADLQSAPFGHSGTRPNIFILSRASCRTRTNDLEITNHVLYQLS